MPKITYFSSSFQTHFTCQEKNLEVEELFLQENYLVEVSVPDILDCFPNVKYINLIGNPLRSLQCSENEEISVVFTCSSFLKMPVCENLPPSLCCCYGHFEGRNQQIQASTFSPPMETDSKNSIWVWVGIILLLGTAFLSLGLLIWFVKKRYCSGLQANNGHSENIEMNVFNSITDADL